MFILCDSRQKEGKHTDLEAGLIKRNHVLIRTTLPVGDYCAMTMGCYDIFENRRHEIYTNTKYLNGEEKQLTVHPQDTLGCYSVAVDVKRVNELQNNLLNASYNNRYRFERECIRARNLGVMLYFLICSDDIKCEEDFLRIKKFGKDEECGQEMLNKMRELTKKYGCKFLIVSKENLASVIEELLSTECLKWIS